MIFYYLTYLISGLVASSLVLAYKFLELEAKRFKNSIYYHKALCRRGEIIDVEYEEVI